MAVYVVAILSLPSRYIARDEPVKIVLLAFVTSLLKTVMPKNLSTVLQVIEELRTMLDCLLASSTKYLGGQETSKKRYRC